VRARFGPFTIDSDTRQLLRAGAEVHLSPKAFDLFCTLIESRPKVVDKETLHARIWPDTYVVDANLNVLVGEIRRAIGDNRQQPEFVRTVHGIGYAFCGAAVQVEAAAAAPEALFCWVAWASRTSSLSEGENVIGRDPRCGVWLDEEGISRRHAAIRVDSATRRVTLEDLASTNGTFLRRSRVRTEVALEDGDEIKVGTVALTIRLWASDKAPHTKRIRKREKRPGS
jgi:DNA-binding winged helix-turn-helix (wHTH) protein